MFVAILSLIVATVAVIVPTLTLRAEAAEKPAPATADAARNRLVRKLRALDGRQYYLLQRGYTCRGFGPGGAPQPSWKGRLEIRAGRVLDWGDRCANEGLPADLRRLEIGFWGHTLHYRGAVYREISNVDKRLNIEAAAGK